MRQSVDETQFAVLDAEEMGIWRSTASGRGAGAESAERHDRSNRLVNDEAPIRDVDAARHANLAPIVRGPLAGMHPAFGAVARVTPWHEVHLSFEECVQVSVS